MDTQNKIFISSAKDEDFSVLLELWEASVRATHHFLQEEDIYAIKPMVEAAFGQVEVLLYAKNEAKDILGFIGIDENKVEMLFLDPLHRGKGLGKNLIAHAIAHHGIRYVDVNEQNEQAVGFYYHMGFHEMGRSETDPMGNPFPLLHMALKML